VVPDEKATIFVVDDDMSVRRAMQRLMRSAQLDVQTFASAEEFIQAGCMDLAGCLLLDVRMPGLNGLELQELMGSRGCRMPVIFISAHCDEESRDRAMASGALDFFTKPVDDVRILQTIRNALRSSDQPAGEEEGKPERPDP